ncbi:MAG TPA: phytanoyl-CoA dioxygenase family protein [Candidatus Acidoferrales bacterium]|jgi:ectoine hydroxylase-related dioxygenase (phytanoyl-CoA dioxygenase family)|nr:phytanoyl-CoA dioxygenase family protein [Candidatus Acidoferrales bacterium]
MQQAEVEKKGFAILPEVLTRSDLDQLDESLKRDPLPRSRAGMRHAIRHPAVLAVARESRLRAIAQEVLGCDPFPFTATWFDKSTLSNWIVAWHQDKALPLRDRRELPGWGPWSVKDGVIYANAPASALSRVVALRLHLDDSTPENGPVRVLPGTHSMGVLSDDAIRGLSARTTAVDCLVPRGGILIMSPLIVHASSKSPSALPRRVLHVAYAASATIAEGLELAIA